METVSYFYANFATLAMNLRHHTELKHPARKYLPVIDNSKKLLPKGKAMSKTVPTELNYICELICFKLSSLVIL